MKTLRWTGDRRDPIRLEYHGSPLAWSFPEHRHEGHWELTYLQRGSLRHVINGVAIDQAPGGLAIIRERDRHALEGHGVTMVNLGFTTAIAATLASLPRREDDALRWLDEHPGPLACRVPSGERPRWDAAFDRLGAAIGGGDEMPAMLAVLGEAVLACRRGARDARDAQPPDWLVPLQALLHDVEIDVPDLAVLRRQAGVSREHLARSFRRHLGMSPTRFLSRCRALRLAHALRHEPDRAVGELAERAGFASLTHAARCFRDAFGTSPRAWRRQQGGFQLTVARQAELYHERDG